MHTNMHIYYVLLRTSCTLPMCICVPTYNGIYACGLSSIHARSHIVHICICESQKFFSAPKFRSYQFEWCEPCTFVPAPFWLIAMYDNTKMLFRIVMKKFLVYLCGIHLRVRHFVHYHRHDIYEPWPYVHVVVFIRRNICYSNSCSYQMTIRKHKYEQYIDIFRICRAVLTVIYYLQIMA